MTAGKETDAKINDAIINSNKVTSSEKAGAKLNGTK